MSGSIKDPAAMIADEKLDFLMAAVTQIMGHLSTINGRLDSHDWRLAQVEKTLEKDDSLSQGDAAGQKADGEVITQQGRSAPGGCDDAHIAAGRSTGRGGNFYGRQDQGVRSDQGWAHGGRDRGWVGDGFHGRGRQDDGNFHRPKFKFPSFDGESDPLTWVSKSNTYFQGMKTMEEEKVWIEPLHLEGVAVEWYYALERDHGILSWARFVDFVHMRFGPPLRHNGLAELKDLYRTGTVEEYQCQFSSLLCHCDDLSPVQQVNLFTVGLGEPLRTDVELHAPSHLQTSMSLARAYERKETATPGINNRGTGQPTSITTKKDGVADTVVKITTNQPRFKCLTEEELAEKRANGECYYCPEKYSINHKCAAKGIFLLEMDDNGEDGDTMVTL
ncbi:hypothetical protein GUJ93_ZPchr0012g20401 [Zizania palustris]|uniref:Retrotransposon gag domain-containing protein n=1 Tax=Zizania palustris TaxID=103762 RepID=A0A8J6BSS4_ZIZPA|nr:hypothetical protein GUJ93_ZPchr0012g20401 [Zizania palustris]